MAARRARTSERPAAPRTRAGRRGAPATDRTPWPPGPVATRTGTAEVLVSAEDRDRLTLLVNGVPSSHLDLADPSWLEFEYMQQMAAVIRTARPGPLRALHLGAGGCTLARWLDHERPGSRQLAVDVDDVLVRLVREWFDLPRSPALRIRAADAGAVVADQRTGTWDVVVRDVFAGDRTPRPLTTTDFAAQARRVLAPGGLYLVNCADRPPLTTARAEVATLRTAFPRTAVLAEPGVLKGRRYGNVVLVATDAAGPQLDDARLERAVRSLAVPVRLLTGSTLTDFVAGAPPILADSDDAPGTTEVSASTDVTGSTGHDAHGRDEAAPSGESAASDV